jgi:hypothetical protein
VLCVTFSIRGIAETNFLIECCWVITMKMLLNDVWAHISYEDDGHLVHTDKRTGKQKISFRMWPDIASANRTLTAELGKIQWDEWEELD